MDGVFAWIAAMFTAMWPGNATDRTGLYYGYVEADYAYIAPAHGGTLAEVLVGEGDMVEAGAVLFRLDARKEQAALATAKAMAGAAKARFEDRLTGNRPQEIAIISDTLARVKADLELAIANFGRSRRLRDKGVVSGAQYDKDQTALAAARARVSEIEAQLVVARMPARAGLIAAAREDFRAAEAEVVRNRALVDETTIRASVDGQVDRVFFEAGEQTGPSTPVISLLPQGALKVRFFLPQAERAAFATGRAVVINCDGCKGPISARIVRLATQSEFTPPVIYSLDERSRLVFMAEARPEVDAPGLLPGQPVDVRRAP